ncbi:MAG: hypothetical protein NC832_00200, partial [Candidatus Omnitrophica bacterium]|nr:hypothetical protein [Candidatus Omnitrophota bacterium]
LKIPERYEGLMDKIKEVKREYMLKKGEMPTDEDIAESLNLPVEVLKKLKRYGSKIRVISSDFYNGEKQVDLFDIMDFSKEEELNLWEILRNKDLLQRIFERLRMKKRKRKTKVDMWLKVIEMYYGLDGKVPLGYTEISKKLNVSRQRIQQIKDVCLQKLIREWKEMEKEEKRDDRDKIVDKDSTGLS